MEKKITAALIHLDQKLMFIPLVFILLRIWGTLRFFISFDSSCHKPCADSLIVTNPCKKVLYNPFLMVMQAICDPGQGWGNALIFVIFHKTLAKRLCPCVFFIGGKIKKCYQDSSVHRGSSPSVNESRDPLIAEDGHHTPSPSDEMDWEKKQFYSPSRTQTAVHV